MMEELLKVAQQYGPFGVIILACFWYILYKDKARKDEQKIHQEERKELANILAKQHQEALEVTKNNTTVLTEISTLIKSRN